MRRVKVPDEVSDVVCDKCGRMMVYKMGRYGKFLACPGFPECRNIKSIVVDAGFACADCGSPMTVRKTKAGKTYYSCSNYPTCKYMTWDKPGETKKKFYRKKK